MFGMTPEQFTSFVRTIMGIVGSAAVTHGVVTQASWITYTGAAVALAPFVWGWVAHTQAATVLAASKIDGVKPIEITGQAAMPLQQLAIDRTIPTVIAATPR